MRRPPKLAESLVRLALPGDDEGASILGDLREELTTDTYRADSPALWYWRQALGLSFRYTLRRLSTALRSMSLPTPEPQPTRRHPPKGASMLETFRQDLFYALRTFAKNPTFTAIALVILTLGIGATTAIFTVVDAVLLESLPYDDPERIVRLRHGHTEYGFDGVEGGGGFSPQDFEDLAGEATSFERLAVYRFAAGNSTANLLGEGRPERIDMAMVSGEFFGVFGRDAALGRTVTPDEAVPGKDSVVVLSHAFWKTRFGGDPAMVGRTISMDGTPMEVLGVMPSSFDFPSREVDVWAPISLITDDMIPHRRQLRWMHAIARLAPGVGLDSALAETRTILSRLADAHPDTNKGWTVADVTALHDALVGGVRPALLVLMAATGLVLLVACANLANLLLARGTGRGREIAVRMSLGASRGRLMRQLLTESLLLSVTGGLLGLVAAISGVRVLLSMSAGTLPLTQSVGADLKVVGFALSASILTGAVFGLLPAWTTAGLRPASMLREGSSTGGKGQRHALRSLLVLGETSLAVVLVVGSGLMLKSFWKLVRVDPGFETESVLTFAIKTPRDIETGEDRIAWLLAYQEDILEAVEQLPGVLSAGASKTSPMTGGGEPFGITAVDADGNERKIRADSGLQIVTPGYFETLGVTVLRGRTFTRQDPATYVVVNQALADQYWPGENAVGQLLGTGPKKLEIVGVVDDIHHEGMAAPARSALYVTPRVGPRSAMNVFVRTASEPLAIAESVREAVWSVNPNQPIADLGRLSETIDANVAQPRFFTTLLAAFAGLALALAALGIYGVVTYTVGQRTGELGLRMALGARGWDVLRLVVSQSMVVCLAGLAVGLVGAFWLSRVLSSLLYGVDPRDPATFAAVAVLLVVVSLAASFVPALRATRVDPVSALRAE